nr:hypothetical protein [Tanacetum cinerariifolium]
FLIIPRLQRLYKSSHSTKEMIWDATGKCTEPGKMQHPVNGRAWNKFDTKYLDFLKEPKNVRLGLAADGFNPDPPKEFGQDEILAQLDRLPTRVKGLWLGKTKNGKCLKPQATYSFTPENRKKFCQFIKGVKLPDGFRSCFKYKVTDNDTNITGMKSHDCHIMMQCLLPYGLQQYLPDKIGKPIIELCSLFKQICSATLMEDDMLKSQIKALEGGPIRPWWMFPFEIYMKELKGYVRNKAKQEGSILKGYVAEEALTFNSHYFLCVTTKLIISTVMWIPLPQRVSFRCFNRLNDLDNETLHIDGQSTEVDAPPYIIDVVEEDDDIIDDEDAFPHDLADFDDEDLINVDDDGVDKVYSSEEED